MAAAEQEGGAALSEAAWVSILLALVAVLVPLLVLAGVPESGLEIGVTDVTFVALVSVLIYRIETYLHSVHRPTLFRERPVVGLAVAFIAMGAIAGTLAELAASSEDTRGGPAVVAYERQVQKVLGPLREAGAEAFGRPAVRGDADRYVKAARELSESYTFASRVLAGIEPARPGDQLLHSLLVARLASVGEACARLANAVSSGAGKRKAAAVSAEVESAFAELRAAEEALADAGYRVLLPT